MTWKTLPAWTYNNAEFLALEKEAIFMRTWQLVGHVPQRLSSSCLPSLG